MLRKSTVPPNTYTLALAYRAGLVLFGVVFTLGTLMLAVNVIAVPLVVVLGVIPIELASRALVVGYFFRNALFLVAFVYGTHRLVTIPIEITIDEERTVSFRNWFQTRSIPAAEIISISTGGWRDSNSFLAQIRHKQGKIILVNSFPEFRDFLAVVKSLNRTVEIKGF